MSELSNREKVIVDVVKTLKDKSGKAIKVNNLHVFEVPNNINDQITPASNSKDIDIKKEVVK